MNLKADQKKLLVAFLKARRARAECDDFLAQNKAGVLDILGKIPGGNFEQAGAMIYRADAISYQYPEPIIEAEYRLTQIKKLAQLDGSANRVVKGCVKFEELR